MNEEQLRGWVARQSKWDTVPTPFWEDAVKGGWVKEVLEGSVDRNELLTTIREWSKRYRRMRNWEQRRDRDRGDQEGQSDLITQALGHKETQRADAVADFVAKIAACERGVFAFRKRFLNGTTLSHEQAQAIITSPAAAYLPFRYFTPSSKSEIPLINHVATLMTEPWQDHDNDPYPLGIFVDPPGRTFTVRVGRTEILLYIDEEGQTGEVLVEEHSVLEGLRRLSTRLAAEYPWQEAQASWFVLTGEPPALPAATGRLSRGSAAPYGEITMKVQPWVSADSVRKFYGYLQGQMLASQPRAVSERNLAVFRFVVAQQEVMSASDGTRPSGLTRRHPKLMKLKQPSWRVMLERWNREYAARPKWQYTNVRNFERDFQRAARGIVSPTGIDRALNEGGNIAASGGSSSGSNGSSKRR